MRVLALTRYGRIGASSRVRFFQFVPELERCGLQVQIEPLFPDSYVSGLQRGKRAKLDIARAYTRRLIALRQANRFDVLWLEKELLPWLPAWFELWVLGRRVPLVLDYDDAVFHTYDQHPFATIRTLLANKHPHLMRRAECVVAGNEYIADFARQAGARKVVVLPSAVDLDRYRPARDENSVGLSAEVPIVGWIGQRSTSQFLSPLKPVFERLSQQRLAQFVAVGIDATALGLPIESVPWTEVTEVDSIRNFNVGIMPLADGPFERGKCGYKLLQYMACGLPVVASPIGVNRLIVEDGVNGFLATSEAEWETAICALVGSSDMRARMGAAGRRKVEREYSVTHVVSHLSNLLQSACRGNNAA